MDESDLVLQRETVVRAALGGVARFRMLLPSVPSYGIGALRALRVKAVEGGMEIVAGYDRYEPIAPGRRAR